jgi:hypothetical protein
MAYGRFLVFFAHTGADREGQLRGDFTRLPRRSGMAAICAFLPSTQCHRIAGVTFAVPVNV